MDALVFAAGLGTRLAPLTDRMPKALVEIAGVPMLEHVARHLVAAGADRLVINVHPFPEQVEALVTARNGFGAEVSLSHERDGPLETGGGLLHARARLRGDAPFFLHNADVLTDLPLEALYRAHQERADALATLAVMERETSRYLLFDDAGLLGRIDRTKDLEIRVRDAVGPVRPLAFAGIHVASPRLPDLITEKGAFSILAPYLRLAAAGARIGPFRVDAYAWRDVGRPEQLEEARKAAREGT